MPHHCIVFKGAQKRLRPRHECVGRKWDYATLTLRVVVDHTATCAISSGTRVDSTRNQLIFMAAS